MEIRDIFSEIAQEWEGYRKNVRVDSSHRVFQLINHLLPETMSNLISDQAFTYSGSTGIGNISRVPWAACFHKDITSSAQEGYYCVYLFSTKMERLFLSFGLGCMAFEKKFGDVPETLDKIAEACALLRNSTVEVLKEVNDPLFRRIALKECDLGEKFDLSLGRKYEKGTVMHLEYDLNNLPKNQVLEDDLDSFTSFYKEVVTRGKALSDTELAEEVSKDKEEVTEITEEAQESEAEDKEEVTEITEETPEEIFEERKLETNTPIGFIVKYEITRLSNLGLDSSVVKDLSRNYPREGCDVLSLNEAGENIFIKVGSSAFAFQSLIISTREHELLESEKDKYEFRLISFWKDDQKQIVEEIKGSSNDFKVEPYSFKVKKNA